MALQKRPHTRSLSHEEKKGKALWNVGFRASLGTPTYGTESINRGKWIDGLSDLPRVFLDFQYVPQEGDLFSHFGFEFAGIGKPRNVSSSRYSVLCDSKGHGAEAGTARVDRNVLLLVRGNEMHFVVAGALSSGRIAKSAAAKFF